MALLVVWLDPTDRMLFSLEIIKDDVSVIWTLGHNKYFTF